MRRVYLASRYSRRDEMAGKAGELVNAGFEVTSRWIYGTHEIVDGRSREAAHEDRIKFAEEDLEDLLAADTVISFTEPEGDVSGRGRGGRHVEFGAALQAGKRLIVVGHRENVFHSLPQVEFFETWGDCLRAVAGLVPLPF